MKENFPSESNMKQALEINACLGKENGASPMLYIVGDIFNILPQSITYNGHRGDLNVSAVDIAYFSIDNEWKHILVHHESIPLGGDIFDAFINMITWLKKNNLM